MSAYLNKVVFIDDDPTTNTLHKAFAESVGLAKTLEFFESGEEALKKYESIEDLDEFPDLFVVDLNLPRISGHELGLSLRKLPGYSHKQSKICFLTASKDIRDVIMADSHEFDHYYWKPLDKRKIQQLLREAFGIVE